MPCGESCFFPPFPPPRSGQGLRVAAAAGGGGGGGEDGRGEATGPLLLALLSNLSLPLLLSLFSSSHSGRGKSGEAAPVHVACNPLWLLTHSCGSAL